MRCLRCIFFHAAYSFCKQLALFQTGAYNYSMKLWPSTSSVSPNILPSLSESSKEAVAVARSGDANKSAAPVAATVSAQVDLRSSRINDLSDTAWINEPPALDTAMLDQIKTAIREGRFVINEQAIAQALSDDASR